MMVNTVMMCCWVLSLFQLSFGLVHSNIHLDDSKTSLRWTEPSFFSDIVTQRSRADPVLLPDESVEEQLMMDPGSYDEDFSQDDAMQHQSRAMRSHFPRRCIPHQQSCLGHQLPCCNPCDTCHCRFFNAFCSCRRLGQSCTNRRTKHLPYEA